jgi:hypothetical protein
MLVRRFEAQAAIHGEAKAEALPARIRSRKSSPSWIGKSLVGKGNKEKGTQEICAPCVPRHYLAV